MRGGDYRVSGWGTSTQQWVLMDDGAMQGNELVERLGAVISSKMGNMTIVLHSLILFEAVYILDT